jgi:spermidine/putrescine-binding protein
MDEQEAVERRLSRDQLFKIGAAAGGATLLGGRLGSAQAAVDWLSLSSETGRLQVLDWAGYGNDGGQAMFSAYVKGHPHNKPQFTYMTNESDALAKIHAGLKPDLFRPYVGWVKYFATSGLVQPWNPRLIKNFKHLNPFMVKAGQYKGKQYGIPDDWGFARSSTAATRCIRRRARGACSSTSATRVGSRGSTTSRCSSSRACASGSRGRGARRTSS